MSSTELTAPLLPGQEPPTPRPLSPAAASSFVVCLSLLTVTMVGVAAMPASMILLVAAFHLAAVGLVVAVGRWRWRPQLLARDFWWNVRSTSLGIFVLMYLVGIAAMACDDFVDDSPWLLVVGTNTGCVCILLWGWKMNCERRRKTKELRAQEQIRKRMTKRMKKHPNRVNSIHFHPTKSWAMTANYSGSISIWDHESGSALKTIEVSDLPVCCARFIPRKQWVVACGHDTRLRVFDYSSSKKLEDFQAHDDIVRHVEVHPTLPFVLTSSDDTTIKCWSWESGFSCVESFREHEHYVMMARFNPKDPLSFASASLDWDIKVWKLGHSRSEYTLSGHDRGLSCIEYHPKEPYIIAGSDDHTVMIWNYETRSILHTLDGHSNNVSSVLFHPSLPLICSAAEDGTVRLWQIVTDQPGGASAGVSVRQEATLDYGLGSARALSAKSESNKLAMGFDRGAVTVGLGLDIEATAMGGTTKPTILLPVLVHTFGQ